MNTNNQPESISSIIGNRLNLDLDEVAKDVEKTREKFALAFPTIRFNMSPEKAFRDLLCYYQLEVQNRYRVFKCDEFTQKAVLEAACYLTQKIPVSGLMFCGTQGNGKTTMAKAILRMIRELKHEGHFKKWGPPDMIDTTFFTATEICNFAKSEKNDMLNRIKRSKVLVIDDLGEEPKETMVYGTPSFPMREVLEARYDSLQLTIVTTNLTPDDLLDHYGWRVVDRFREVFKQIIHKGPSYR